MPFASKSPALAGSSLSLAGDMSIWDFFFGSETNPAAATSAPIPPRSGIGMAPQSAGMSFAPILPTIMPQQPLATLPPIPRPRPRPAPEDVAQVSLRPRPRPADLGSGGSQAAPASAQGRSTDFMSLLDKLGSSDRVARLAMILDGMSLRPNEALQAAMRDKIATNQQKKTSSRTAAWLRSLGTPQATQAADALDAGAIDAQTAVAFATKKQDDGKTALMQNYEYALAQGMTPEQARQWVSNSPTVNVGGKGETAFEVENAKAQSAMFSTMMQDGINAKGQIGQIDVIESLLASGVGGTSDAWKAWAQETLGVNIGAGGAVEALNATINQLVPSQRAPGSGSMSDRDVALFKSSLPALVNSPEGNRIIVATMRGMAEYKRAQGEIATAVALGQMSREDGLAALSNLPDPMANVIPLIRQIAPSASAPASTMSREDAARLLLQQ